SSDAEPARESRRARRRRNRQRQEPLSLVPPPAPIEVVPPVVIAKPARLPAPPRQLATPRVAKPRLARKHVVVAGAALVLVLGAIGVGLMARRPIAAIMVGHYGLELT